MPKIKGYKGWRVRKLTDPLIRGWDFIIFPDIDAGFAKINRVGRRWVATIDVTVGKVDVAWRKSFNRLDEAIREMNRQRRKISKKVFKMVD